MKQKRPLRLFLSLSLGLLACFVEAQTLETPLRKEGKLVRKAFDPITDVLQQSSAVFYTKSGAQQYGVVVSADGEILVKSSELEMITEPYIVVGKKTYRSFETLATDPVWDLALVKIDAENLTPIDFADYEPTHGTIVISNSGTGRFSRRGQMGVIAANAREVTNGSLAVLGISLRPTEDGTGLVITGTQDGSGAAKADLQANDRLLMMDEQSIATMDDVMAALEIKMPGDPVTVVIERIVENATPVEIADPFAYEAPLPKTEELSFEIQLSERQDVFQEEITRNDLMSGRISKRRTNFPRVLQHDTSLTNRTTGGPLLDLSGRCVGLNIAYASRECSYAIPAREVQDALQSLRGEQET